MSEFHVPIVKIRAIEEITGADLIELAVVGDYRSVVQKNTFKAGMNVVYLPEGSVLPDALIETLGLTGKLAGSAKNRVKAVRLRGCLSQGILYDAAADFPLGHDMAEALAIFKYEPPVPSHMAGEVANLSGKTIHYDIENVKAFPDVILDGEMVEMTEKAHGTFCAIAVIPGLDHPEMFGGDGLVYSKGLGSKGLVFKDVETNRHNIYVEMAQLLEVHASIRWLFPNAVVHVFGELYGLGVQDLAYFRKDRSLVVFDINVDGRYLSRDELASALIELELRRVPILYRGPFSKEIMLKHTTGRTVLGSGAHIREGLVITPLIERQDNSIGRVILKSVSGDYLTRKGDVTEFS